MAEWRGDGEPAGSSRSGATGAAEKTERSEVNPTSSAISNGSSSIKDVHADNDQPAAFCLFD